MTTNKTVGKIKTSLTFLHLQFMEAVLVFVFAAVVFGIFVVTVFAIFVSATLFKYLLFSQIHVLGSQLKNRCCTYDNFYIYVDMFYYSIFVLNYIVEFSFTITRNMLSLL